MKRLHYLYLPLITLVLCLLSCKNENVKRLKNDVNVVNSVCPIYTGWGILESFTYDEKENQVVVNCRVSWLPFGAQEIPSEKVIKRSFILNMIYNDVDKRIFTEAANAKASIIINYQMDQLGRDLLLKLTEEEVREIAEPKITRAQARTELLEMEVEIARNELSKEGNGELGPGMRITDIKFDGDAMVYDIAIDDKILDFDMMKEDKEVFKSELEYDPNTNELVSMLNSIGANLIYRFSASPDKSFEIIF